VRSRQNACTALTLIDRTSHRSQSHAVCFARLLILLCRPLVALSIFLAACRAADDDALHLLCWSEYVPLTVIGGFTQKTGVKVVVENYNSNEQMLAMLKAKPAFYDLVQPSQAYVAVLIKAGGLEPIDRIRIPNWRNIDPRYLGLPHDPESKFSVPWLAGTVGIVVNTDLVKDPIRTWADVFSGKYRGRIVIVDDHREMVAWALASLGLPITDVSDGNLAKVEPVLMQWLPQVAVFDSDSPHTALLSEKAVIGIVWSGEAALLWQRDRKFQYVLPNEGAHMFLDSLAIPAKSPHQKQAEDFINYCLEPDVSVLISHAYPYTNPNRAARERLSAEQLANPASYLPGNPRLLPLRNVGNATKTVDAFVRSIRSQLAR
jgi:spermidine/putrescine transport system permease protein